MSGPEARDLPLTLDDSVWGALSIDRGALLDALKTATDAMQDASTAALWQTSDGRSISSAWSDVLFGVCSVVDGLIELLDVQRPGLDPE